MKRNDCIACMTTKGAKLYKLLVFLTGNVKVVFQVRYELKILSQPGLTIEPLMPVSNELTKKDKKMN